MFVDGAWAAADSGATFTAESPATGEAIAEVPEGDREDAQRAIAAANRAAPAWANAGAFERAAAMHRVADEVERRRTDLTHTLTLDQGKPLAESRDEVDELIQYWRTAAEDTKRLEGRVPNSVSADKRILLLRRPRGVVGVITPWNWPYTRPACHRGSSTTSPGRARQSATRSRATRARTASASSARPRPDVASPRRPR